MQFRHVAWPIRGNGRSEKDTSSQTGPSKQVAQRELNAVVAEAMLAMDLSEPGALSSAQIAQIADHIQSEPTLTSRIGGISGLLDRSADRQAQVPFELDSEDFQFHPPMARRLFKRSKFPKLPHLGPRRHQMGAR